VTPASPKKDGWRAPQHRDGMALVLSSGVASGVGLLYWVLAARLFDHTVMVSLPAPPSTWLSDQALIVSLPLPPLVTVLLQARITSSPSPPTATLSDQTWI